MDPTPSSPRPSALARVLSAALAYATAAVVLRMAVHAIFSSFRNSDLYRAGLLLSLPTTALVGLVIGLVVVRRSRMAVAAWLTLSGLLLSGIAAASHYHAIFNALPDRGLLHFVDDPQMRGSYAAALPWFALVAELLASVTIAGALFGLLTRSRWVERHARALVVAVAIPGIVLPFAVPGSSGQLAVGRADPWMWLATYTRSGTETLRWDGTIEEAFALVHDELGWPELGDVDGPYPLCRQPAGMSAASPDRSVIFVMFEGLTYRELQLEHNGVRVCPNIAGAFDDGVSFDRLYASGAQTAAVLESLYGGLPPNPHRIMLQHLPVPRVQGWVGQFAQYGWTTAYFHGADLAFENKRPFMSMIGFEVLAEPDLDRAALAGGAWGENDEQTFGRMVDWISSMAGTNTPYFAAITTLSAHHPYVVPDDFDRIDTSGSEFGEFANAYHYTDEAFAEFYTWYRENELPRGTLLVIAGEHTPRLPYPTDPTETTTGMFEFRFEIPLTVIGLSEAEAERVADGAQRAMAHYDLGPTLLGLLDIPAPSCGVGRDILEDDVPATRLIPSHAGHIPYFLYFQQDDLRWMYDFHAERLRVYNTAVDPLLRRDLAATHPDSARMMRLVAAYVAVTGHLDSLGNRAPAEERVVRDPVTAEWPPPRFGVINPRRPGVSYGHGALSWAGAQTSPVNLQARFFTTGDRQLVLSSGLRVSGGEGEDYVSRFTLDEIRGMVDVDVVTLDELVGHLPVGSTLVVEFNAQIHPRFELDGLAALERIEPMAAERNVRLVLRTNSVTVANSANGFPRIDFWLDPDNEPDTDLVEFALRLGIDGLVLQAVRNPEQVRELHQAGLLVVVDGVPEADVDRLQPLGPGAIVLRP